MDGALRARRGAFFLLRAQVLGEAAQEELGLAVLDGAAAAAREGLGERHEGLAGALLHRRAVALGGLGGDGGGVHGDGVEVELLGAEAGGGVDGRAEGLEGLRGDAEAGLLPDFCSSAAADASVALVTAAACAQAPANVSADRVTFYTEPNFKGEALIVEAGASVEDLARLTRPSQRPWAYAISSVLVEGATRATVFAG